MTSYVTIKDGASLYNRLLAAFTHHDGYPLEQATAVLDVLRDMGTPAIVASDCSIDLSQHICTHPQRYRLVTEWVEYEPQ